MCIYFYFFKRVPSRQLLPTNEYIPADLFYSTASSSQPLDKYNTQVIYTKRFFKFMSY